MTTYLATLGGIIVAVLTIWAVARPHIRRVGAAADVILGEEAVPDRSGKGEITPGRPGLVHRMTTVEKALAALVDQAERLDNHEQRLSVLETATFERLAAKIESAAMLRMIAEENQEKK